jgi:3-deoxy-D-manno-octulosonic-acid transferase
LFNSKVREGIKGRRDLFNELNRSLSAFDNKKRVLIHSSSLGEYQQSIPLMDEFVKKDHNVVHSFFSPSGYRNCKLPGRNIAKTYLPFDSYRKSRKFLESVKPDTVVFMRYDLWYNLVYAAKKLGIRLVVANARFDEKDRTWSLPVVSSFKKTMYRMLDDVFVIDEFDEKNYKRILEGHGPQVIKAGDSKFERVYQTARVTDLDGIFHGIDIKAHKVFVMGSSWKDDEEVLFPAVDKALEYHPDLLVMLVPHEPKQTKIEAIERSLEKHKNIRSIRLSSIEKYSNENLIIIDRIGILSKLYSIAYLSYVGGGLRTGLHNILEPAIFNMPIFFANRVKNSDEDEILVAEGCGIVVKNTKQFYRRFRELLSDRELRDSIGAKSKRVFRNSAGIAETIVNHIT